MNRLTRDQILLRALSMVDSPRLDEKDQPTTGTITSSALSIGWLQDALDLAHNLYPQAGALKTASMTFTTGTAVYTITSIATDFILDFKDGIVLSADKGRLNKRSLNRILDYQTSSSSYAKPTKYTIHNGTIVVRPVPNDTYTATLYYYSLPATLSATTVPNFPSDLLLVEYVHLRGREWLRELPAGTAEKYLIDAVARLQKSGLGPEAEIDDTITLDRDVFPGGGTAFDDPDWFVRVNA